MALWREAGAKVRYSDQWPISESDFATAKRLVEPLRSWREILTDVSVTGPDEIRIGTTYWRIFSRERMGRFYMVKKVNGEWTVADGGRWRWWTM